jgi:hypothetical protein
VQHQLELELDHDDLHHDGTGGNDVYDSGEETVAEHLDHAEHRIDERSSRVDLGYRFS